MNGIYRRSRPRRRRWLILFLLPLLPVLWGGYQAASILYIWKTSEPVKAPVAVILGAAVWDGKPSPAFRERLDVAVSLYEQNLTERFFCTGGTPGGEPPEATVCAKYLEAHGVPSRAISQETASRSTWENLTNARALLQAEGQDQILVVTHGFHLKRALIQ
ncbi:MAG TPA: YdcF family protein, partial [Symbiobacteriaceae bacterium]|nr:YdcF family protein [Symbiobacteriaceae bacterium]